MSNKKKILFIVPHRLNRSPGQRFRCEQYLNYLSENNYNYTYSNIISKWDDKIYYSKRKIILKSFIVIKSIFIRFYDVLRAKNYDLIFIYREAFMLGTTFFETLFKFTGTKIIFDFDDAIWLNNTSHANEKLDWLKNPGKTAKIIEISDMVLTGNNYLASYSKLFNSNTKIIPTTINTDYHFKKPFSKRKNICIGWTGSHSTLEYFKLALPILKEVYNKYNKDIDFKVIVDIDFEEPDINLTASRWAVETEIEDLSEIDIGIMPLPDDEWAKGKCGFKALQYMALEIPTVLSPVGVNTEIIEDGINGFLASTNEDWVEKLSLLIESKDLRERLGKAGRQTVIEKYSYQSQKEKYLNYFNELIEKNKMNPSNEV